MEDFEERVMTVISYGDEGEVSRVTIAVSNVNVVIAGEKDVILDGRPLKRTNVLYMDGSNIEIMISELDLITLERAVGTYLLP